MNITMAVLVWHGFVGSRAYTTTIRDYFSRYPEKVEEFDLEVELFAKLHDRVDGYMDEIRATSLFPIVIEYGDWLCKEFETRLRVPDDFQKEKKIFEALCDAFGREVAFDMEDLFNHYTPSEFPEDEVDKI